MPDEDAVAGLVEKGLERPYAKFRLQSNWTEVQRAGMSNLGQMLISVKGNSKTFLGPQGTPNAGSFALE